jgi:hypothetical protein
MHSKESDPSRDVATPAGATLLASDVHEAHVRHAIASVDWERRGWLGRLVRHQRQVGDGRVAA